MGKKSKKLLAFVFLYSLIFISIYTMYGNVIFFKGHVFGTTDEEGSISESAKAYSDENVNDKVNLANYKEETIQENNPSTEVEGQVDPQPIEKMAGVPLSSGWEVGTPNDAIENNGYKINWNDGAWWYTHNGNQWMYQRSIEANLIINGAFPLYTSDDPTKGFLWIGTSDSIYSINKDTNSLRRTFTYLDRYTIAITQQMLSNNAVEVTYEVTNKGPDTQKIGFSQFVDTFVGTDDVPVTPINNFRGINLTKGIDSLVIMPDAQSVPNWAAGNYFITPNFLQYKTQDSVGIGWETGKLYRDPESANLYPSPIVLKENRPVNIGDSGVSMKNPGVNVGNNESILFKQTLKYGKISLPQITVNPTKASIYQHEKIVIDGTISDEDTRNFRVYLEMDDNKKTLIQLAEFTNIPYNETQTFQGTIEGKGFSPGIHKVSVIGINEYGSRSVPQKIELTIKQLDAVPAIQKVKIGESISNDLNTLFKTISGTNVALKAPLSIDSSIIGFQWVEATLVDSSEKEITVKIPVNVYNPDSTVFNDADNIALDAKDTSFSLAVVNQSAADSTLDELVLLKVDPKAWDMEDGNDIPFELIENGIKPLSGKYEGTFKATRSDNGKSLEKISQLEVGPGALKFTTLPEVIDFKTTKLGTNDRYVERVEPDWKIEIENTLGTDWNLNATATPFVNSSDENSGQTLIFRDENNQEIILNSLSQQISSGKSDVNNSIIKWDATKGLLVKVEPSAKIGTYKGVINWILTNTP